MKPTFKFPENALVRHASTGQFCAVRLYEYNGYDDVNDYQLEELPENFAYWNEQKQAWDMRFRHTPKLFWAYEDEIEAFTPRDWAEHACPNDSPYIPANLLGHWQYRENYFAERVKRLLTPPFYEEALKVGLLKQGKPIRRPQSTRELPTVCFNYSHLPPNMRKSGLDKLAKLFEAHLSIFVYLRYKEYERIGEIRFEIQMVCASYPQAELA